jgi:uncharacterized membrane protein
MAEGFRFGVGLFSALLASSVALFLAMIILAVSIGAVANFMQELQIKNMVRKIKNRGRKQ